MLFLDTNVVIDLIGRKRPRVRERFAEAWTSGRRPLLSSVALFELRFGAANSGRPVENDRALDALIAEGLEVIAFDAADAAEAGTICALLRRAGKEIGPYDLLIAAQARRRDALLVTHNVAEFERVPGLAVTDWAGD